MSLMNKTIDFHAEPFIPEHWFQIELRQWERDNINPMSVAAIADYGMLFTLFLDGDILAIVGFYEKWEGVFEVYVYPSIHTPRYPVFYVKKIRRYLGTIAKSHKMRRQQTYSLADDATDRWMRALGFQCEGTCREFTARREDVRMWVRFNEVS